MKIKKPAVLNLFRIKMADAKLWKSLIGAISTLVDEARFNMSQEEFKLRAMDPSHVAMVDFEWPKTVFEEYYCDKPAYLCININEMIRLLKRVGSDESVELSLDEKTAKLNIILRGRYTRTFSIPTLEVEGEEVPSPKIVFNAKSRLTTRCLRETVEDALTVSDHVQLEMTRERFIMDAKGELGSVSIDIAKDSEDILELDVKEESKAVFSLNYLSEIIKAASPLSEVASLEFSTDMPVKLNFEMPQGGKLQYYLAPRIDSK